MVDERPQKSQGLGPESTIPPGPGHGLDGNTSYGTPQSESTAVQESDKEDTPTQDHTDNMETAGLSQPGKWSATLRRAWNWKPKPARYDPENPPKFTIWLNMLFGFVSHGPLPLFHAHH
jgi:hypothetical protein